MFRENYPVQGNVERTVESVEPKFNDFVAEHSCCCVEQERSWILELSHHMTVQDVAHHLGVSWDVIKLSNEELTDLKRDLYREATDLLQKKVLKGTRWLLLKNWEKLNDKRNEKQRLPEALHINQPLATAYYMKEKLGLLRKQKNKASADSFLKDRIARAQVSGVRMLRKFARTLAAHRLAILSYYDYPISAGPLEADLE